MTIGRGRPLNPSSGRGGSVVAFFALTYAVTWAFYIPVAAGVVSVATPAGYLAVLAGTLAPSVVALALTARARGSAGARALLDRILHPPVEARWYVFALLYMPVVKLSVAIIHRVSTGSWPRFGAEPWYLMLLAIPISTVVQAGEEIGWRGYALPRLAARLGLGPAGILLGAVWASWHLPLFFVRGAETFGQSFLVYLLQVIAISVAMAWLFGRVGGTLLPIMLMHSAINNTKDIVPSAVPGAERTFALAASPVGWLTLALLWLVAAVLLARMPKWEAGRQDIGAPLARREDG